MKTSIIVSSFAALCLMLTFAESPSRRSTEYVYVTSDKNISYIPAVTVNAEPANIASVSVRKVADSRVAAEMVEDFNYRKFNVADYTADDEMAMELTTEQTFEYLKFNVTDLNESNEFTSEDAIELPLNETEYLKFDVNEYTKSDETTSFETLELPVNDFEYLKFNVQNFLTADDTSSVEIDNLPVEDYSYLKFNVNVYASLDKTNSGNFGELPVSE